MHTCDSTGIHVFPRSLYAYHYYVGVFSLRSFVNIEVGEGEKGWFCLIIVLTKVGEGGKGWFISIMVRSFSLWLHYMSTPPCNRHNTQCFSRRHAYSLDPGPDFTNKLKSMLSTESTIVFKSDNRHSWDFFTKRLKHLLS